jgi:hypothetical protein
MFTKLEISLTVVIACMITGGLIEYKMMKQKMIPVKAEVSQKFSDGGLMLATTPVIQITTTAAIPKGSKLISHSSVTLTKETTASNPKDNQKTTTTLPAIPETVDIVKEKNGNERVIVKAPGYSVNGSEEVLNKEVVIANPKHEIIPLVGIDLYQKKIVYGIQYKYKLSTHLSTSALILGSTIAVGVGVSW